MNLTGEYHRVKTNGNMSHDDLLLPDGSSSQKQTHQTSQIQRSLPPFYLLNHFPLEPPPTGSTNLIVHWGLSRDFDKYVKQSISPALSDFLKDIPSVETAQLKAASFAGDAQQRSGLGPGPLRRRAPSALRSVGL